MRQSIVLCRHLVLISTNFILCDLPYYDILFNNFNSDIRNILYTIYSDYVLVCKYFNEVYIYIYI